MCRNIRYNTKAIMSSSGSGVFNSTDISCSPFDKEIYSIVAAVAAISGFISLVASCFIIFIIILFKKWNFFSQRLILYLAITAALESLSFVLQKVDYKNQTSPSYDNYCVFTGFINQVSNWMILNAVTSITVFLLFSAFSYKQLERFEVFFIVFIFFFPLTFNWIPFIETAYGKAGPWCWIRSHNKDTCEKFEFGQVLQVVLWYIPLYTIMFGLLVAYIATVVKLHRTKRKWTGEYDPQANKIRDLTARELTRLIAYPLIYFLLNIPILVNHIHRLEDNNNPEPILWFISAAIFPLEGGIIAIAFSLDPETRKRLNAANFTAAFREFCANKEVDEYPIEDGEESITRTACYTILKDNANSSTKK